VDRRPDAPAPTFERSDEVAHLTFDVEQARLAGERVGTGTPTVVLLHAGVCDRRSWREVADDLGASTTVIAYDRRGFGGTPPAVEPYDAVSDLRTVLDAAPGPAWLVGSSMGGGLAVDAALILSEMVAGLVLLAPGVSGAPEPGPEEIDDATSRIDDALVLALDAGDIDEANRLSTRLWLDGPAEPEGRVSGAPRQLALEMGAIALANDAAIELGTSPVPDAWARLGEIDLPVTVVCGNLDVPFLAEAARHVARAIPGARHIELAGRAHLPYLEDAGQVAALIRAAIGI
jgi:pimeloyl-ACP methyl ester carboxylesterase